MILYLKQLTIIDAGGQMEQRRIHRSSFSLHALNYITKLPPPTTNPVCSPPYPNIWN